MSRIAQKDLAQMLGISQTTVSAVLNNNPAIRVSEATRHRILEAAARANYWPNRLANSLRARKARMIAVLYRPVALQVGVRKYMTVVDAIEQQGYTPLLMALREEGEEEACQLIRDLNVDGVVLVGLTGDFIHTTFNDYLYGKVPVVAVDGDDNSRLIHFRSDRRQGCALLVEHLLSLGYRSFGVLTKEYDGATPYFNHSRSLVESATEALARVNLKPMVIRYRVTMKDDWHDPYHGGQVAMEQLLRRKRCPRAVICNDDSWAIGAMAACWNHGVRVPEDVALAGFQNEVQGLYSHPALTTVDPPIQALAKQAVERLLAIANGAPSTPETVYLPCQLVVRRSCGSVSTP